MFACGKIPSHIGLEKIFGEKRFFRLGPPQKFFQGLSPPFKKFSTVGPVWRGLRGGSARTDPLHHRGFPHSAARARATCLPLPADPAPMFPSAALPRAPSLPPPPPRSPQRTCVRTGLPLLLILRAIGIFPRYVEKLLTILLKVNGLMSVRMIENMTPTVYQTGDYVMIRNSDVTTGINKKQSLKGHTWIKKF